MYRKIDSKRCKIFGIELYRPTDATQCNVSKLSRLYTIMFLSSVLKWDSYFRCNLMYITSSCIEGLMCLDSMPSNWIESMHNVNGRWLNFRLFLVICTRFNTTRHQILIRFDTRIWFEILYHSIIDFYWCTS